MKNDSKKPEKILKFVEFDKSYSAGRKFVVGIDEAGRGCLAGPVCAAAAAIPDTFYADKKYLEFIAELDDSKKLDARARENLYKKLLELKNIGALDFEAAFSDVGEIETLNILGATQLAMKRAAETLNERIGLNLKAAGTSNTLFGEIAADFSRAVLIVDGKPMKKLPFAHVAIVKADAKSLAVATASIVAKFTRDSLMDELSKRYPRYEFEKHKGYGTAAHLQNLLIYGPCEIHRPSFLKILRDDSPKPTQPELLM